MNTKKISTVIIALTALCIVVFANFASATSTYTTSASFSPSGSGYVTSLSNICGSSNDGNYAHIIGPSANDGGQITCTLATTAASGSYVCVYAGGSGDIYIYVKDTSNNWHQLTARTLGGYGWITVQSSWNFRTIAVACYNPTGSTSAYIDCAITT